MTRITKALFLAAAVGTVTQPLSAQSCSIASTSASVSCTVGTTLGMTVPTLMDLTLDGTSVTLAAPSAVTDFDASGLFDATATGPAFQVKSNRSYRVQVQADAATFSHTSVAGAASYAKPAGDVRWSNDGSTFTALTTTATDVGSGSSTALSAAKTISYKTYYDITKDQPGGYSLGVTFTMVAP